MKAMAAVFLVSIIIPLSLRMEISLNPSRKRCFEREQGKLQRVLGAHSSRYGPLQETPSH
jgi:fructose-specific phosphotransferase system IIC component